MPHLGRFRRLFSRLRALNHANEDIGASNSPTDQATANSSTHTHAAAGREFEGTHYHTLLPPSPEAHIPDHNSEGPWRPPTPDRVMGTQEGANHLRTFQHLPGEAQVRAIWLHQNEGMTLEQAIATAAVELRLRLLEYPVQAREAHTAAVRLTLQQVNENLFTEWILLSVLVQTLPPSQQAVGQRILGLLSADPRDIKNIYQARRAAVGLGNDSINRALDRINDNAASFRRNEEDLRGLHQYDRHHPLPEPEPIEGPPEGMVTPEDVLKSEKHFDSSTEAMEFAITGYTRVLNDWLQGLCQEFASEDDPVLQKLAEFILSWARYVHTPAETRQRQVLNYPFNRAAWDDPFTTDPGSILLGAFFKCALVRRDHPPLYHLNLIANWDDWDIRKPAAAAMLASDNLRNMHKAAKAHLDGSRSALCLELASLRPTATPGLLNGLLGALQAHNCDETHLEMLRTVNEDEILTWPLAIQCRLYSVIMLSHAMKRLAFLCNGSRMLAQSLSKLDPFLSETDDLMQDMFKIYGRARRHAFAAWNGAIFRSYHYDAICEFRDMLESCSNQRAKTLMLTKIPESGCGADLQRVRDIAVAASVEKSIRDSAQMLLWQQQDLEQLSEHIRTLEQRHSAYLSRIDIRQAVEILAAESTSYSYEPRYIREYVISKIPSSAAHLDCLGRSDFGPALRDAVLDAIAEETYGAIDLARAFYTASLQRPLQSTVAMIRDHLQGVAHEGLSFASADVSLVARLLLRGVYYSYVDLPPSGLAQAQGLSRHCWILGLLGAWLEWHIDVVLMTSNVLMALDTHDWKYPGRSAMLRWPETRLAQALTAEDKDWDRVEASLAGEERNVVSLEMKDKFYEHIHKLRLLRDATNKYLGLPDAIDTRVLPEDFQAAATACGARKDESFDMLHRMIKFNGSVLDGGSVSVDATGWEDAHEYQLRQMRLSHLSRSRRDSVLM
ncbi:hypothetical protein DBV05_g8408 [Lasiodiplodia theobromae]|uniref:Uncharacterized protein n=1 Tax=Lasiodiplodia theobromae TaxID=45133 RepID=A0A5N5D6F8_9PEZI|nr:hypothetical protein DBV05_g8408 [Lasiodiplodia theobromae]